MTRELSADQYLSRYPRPAAHIVAESRIYIIPRVAAYVLRDAKAGRISDADWLIAYDGDAGRALEAAIRNRHTHRGYRYELAHRLVKEELAELTRSAPGGPWCERMSEACGRP